MPSSNASEPLINSGQSPDTLPLKGYTAAQLSNYILRQLGAPTWNVELSNQQVLDCIQDSLGLWSQWVPIPRPCAIQMVRGQFKYLQGVDVGLGIAKIDFVESNPIPSEVFYANLINPTPLFRTGLDEYDTFLRWRKTWQRVTSIAPDWFYDEYEKVLYIHNPIERYQAGVICYWPVTDTAQLSFTGADWVKRYALAKSRFLLGDIWMKFSGAIPGPAQNLQLDQQRRTMAETEMEKLMEQLKGMQLTTGISVD